MGSTLFERLAALARPKKQAEVHAGIPRSFSIREHHPNFVPNWRALGPKFEVFINDVLATKVIAYDVDEGWVLRYRTDADGRTQLNAARDGAQEEKLFGRVVVRCREALP